MTHSTIPNPRGRPTGTGADPSDAVRLVRDKLGLTQQELAEQIKCSLSAVRYMERGRRLPGNRALLDHFTKIAARAGVDLHARKPDESDGENDENTAGEGTT